jgi:hypothetical protein
MQNGTSRTRASVWASSVFRSPSGRRAGRSTSELDVVDRVTGVHPLVVVVDGTERTFWPLLADDVLVERELDLAGFRELGNRRLRLGCSSISSSMISGRG